MDFKFLDLKMILVYLIASEYMFEQMILNYLLFLPNQMPEFDWNYRIRPKQPIKSLVFAQKFKIYWSNMFL